MKITDVKVQCYSMPMIESRRAAYGGVQEITLLTITTDEGVEGCATARAQAGTSGRAFAEYLTGWVKRAIVGKDPAAREAIWQSLWQQVSRNNLPIFALSVTDVALWDLAGKALGQPVYKLLGECRTQMRAYASSAHMHRPEEYAEDALAMKAAHLCEAFGINIEIHHAGTPLMNWANLACECAIKNTEFFEVMIPLPAFDFGLQQYANIDSDGYVHVLDRPGLGADLDWDYINAHTTYRG